MRTALGVSLFGLGITAIWSANMIYYWAKSELLEKRPGLEKEINFWDGRRMHHMIGKLYKSEFPKGRRVFQFWICTIAGFAFIIAGVATLVSK